MRSVIKTIKRQNTWITLDPNKALRTIESPREYKSGRRYILKTWMFECRFPDCKNEIKVQHTNLKRHSGYCMSHVKKGFPFQASYNELVTTVHKTGKKEISLTYEQFLKFTEIDKCHYCHSHIDWQPHTKIKGKEVPGARSYKLDRKDNNIGYHAYNLVVCCWQCNQSKGDRYSYQEWYKMTESFRVPDKETEEQATFRAHMNQLRAAGCDYGDY